MITFASLFTGGAGADLGARAAGLKPLWGIEKNARIANVARANGVPVVTADVCTARPTDFEPPWLLHASPPCPNFSQANTGGKETAEDVSMAQAVARFVTVLKPRAFTLENVAKYAYSESWRVIEAALREGGYAYEIHGGKHGKRLCSADFGVPQDRRRFYVRAAMSVFLPPLPEPTPWQGWYSAVEDLLPGCPEKKPMDWQIERWPPNIAYPALLSQGQSHDHRGNDYPLGFREAHEPTPTITGNSNMLSLRAALGENHTIALTFPCVARFQGFPDDYIWSDDAQLNALINGNAVPPEQYRRLVAGLVRGW